MRKIFSSAVLIACIGNTEAEEIVNHSGFWLNDLRNEAEAMQARQPGASAFNVGLYYGYVVGAAEITEKLLWCSNDKITNGEVIAAVAKYIKVHPDLLSSSAKALIGNALGEAFPCSLPKK